VPAALATALGLAVMGPLVGVVTNSAFSLLDAGVLIWLRDRTIAAPVLVATMRAMPLPVLICLVAFRTLNRDVLDAALLDGAGRITRIWSLGMRQRRAAMLIAWLSAFALACGELSATIMVNPPGMTTVPIRVFRLLHAGVRHQVAAISLTGLLAIALIAAIITFLAPRVWLMRAAESSDRTQ
jgi:ABC-type Fe3+ transport system permease subunit